MDLGRRRARRREERCAQSRTRALPDGDRLVAVVPHDEGDEILLATADGKVLRTPAKPLRVVKSASAGGVAGMKLAPGDIHHKHRFDHCEVLYYVNSGSGITGAGGKTSRIRAGHVHFIPKGVEHWIANTGKETLEIIGVYTGAGSIADAGYVHTGMVSDAELKAA